MDKFAKYRKLRKRLEFISFFIAMAVGDIVSSILGFRGEKLFSIDTALYVITGSTIFIILQILITKIINKKAEQDNESNERL